MNDEPNDRARVRELLGREPQSDYDIIVRDEQGDPVVLRNAPFLDDGTPMPTRYWLIGPTESRRIGQLEAAGGVNAAEADIEPGELAAAHARYEAERNAAIPDDHIGPRPSGGVGGTRLGVKCLHAHWAWHLAGGDDPVGRWIAAHLEPPDHVALITIEATHTSVRHGTEIDAVIPWGATNLTERWLADNDPPRPEALTNALGTVTDHLDDIVREHPGLLDSETLTFGGESVGALARVEIGRDDIAGSVTLDRQAAEEIFRIVATEPAGDRAFNPGLPSSDVETIVATCSIVLAFMRRLGLDQVTLRVDHRF